MATGAASKWIGSKSFDLAFFFGSSLFAVGVGGLVLAVPSLTIPMWWAFIVLIDGPHLMATLGRTYLDPRERSQRGPLLWWSLLLVASGVAALGLARTANAMWLFDAYLLFAMMWAWHHAVRQHYGIMSVYSRYDGTETSLRRFDSMYLHGVLWAMFAIFLFAHPANREIGDMPAQMSTLDEVGVGMMIAAVALATLVYVASIIRRARRGVPIRPALFVLFPVVTMTAFSLFLVGWAEPLVPAPENPEQFFLASGLVGGIVHGLQYIGIVSATNRRRYRDAEPSLAARIGRSPGTGYMALVALASGYVVLNAARGAVPDLALMPSDSDAAMIFLALYWGVFFHHYYLDQHIWHPGRDPSLRIELGLDSVR
jgi:hypothetical protein